MGLQKRKRAFPGRGLRKELWMGEMEKGGEEHQTVRRTATCNSMVGGRVNAQVCLEDIVEFNLAAVRGGLSPFPNKSPVIQCCGPYVLLVEYVQLSIQRTHPSSISCQLWALGRSLHLSEVQVSKSELEVNHSISVFRLL